MTVDTCMLVAESGGEVLKIIDLGLAKVTRDEFLSRRPTSTAGVIIGSLPYLSPEQARGEAVDERSDLYAAGVVLFELLTRRAPFVGTDDQVVSGHVEKQPPLPSVLAPLSGIPVVLEEVTLRALTKKPDERYQSAVDFDIALVEALAQAGVDIGRSPAFAGCCEAQASLVAGVMLAGERSSCCKAPSPHTRVSCDRIISTPVCLRIVVALRVTRSSLKSGSPPARG